jgi:hypothetical protein
MQPSDTLLVVGLVALGLAAVAVTLSWRRGQVKEAPQEPVDQWDRDQHRRRRKEAVYGATSYLLLFLCAAVAAALSFHGLVGFGRQNLNLSGGWEYLVPFGLDGAAMFCSVLAVREASHGDAAFGSRFLVWTFAGASAWFNWVHAPRGDVHEGAPQFFAGMSIAAAVLFDRALKQTRKAALREQGLVPRPLPQIRLARWLRSPIETYGAWSMMLLEGVRTLDEAVDIVRDDKKEKAQARARARLLKKQQKAEQRALAKQQAALPNPPRVTLEQVGASTPQLSGSDGSEPGRTAAATAGVGADRAGGDRTADLGGEDDGQRQPLQTLEQRLRALERQLH